VYKIIGADGKEYGPITIEVLRQWIAQGRANGQSKVLPEGATEWKTVAELPELAPLLTAPPLTITAPGPISLAPVARNNSFAVAGLTLGILGLTLGLCCCYGLPFSVPGIICSIVALNQIKNDPLVHQGRNLAIAGLILSILSILLGGLLLALGVALSTPDMIRRIQRL
jgi:Domain of unknown function (DUF4190)/GYF domain 2